MDNPSPLCNVPNEVLEKIAFEVVANELIGPPSSLIRLLLTCVHINNVLTFNNCYALYARIFHLKFDTGAVRRRFEHLYNADYAYQLRQYCIAMKILRTGNVFYTGVLDVFLNVFVMLSENDGKNMCQLAWARVDRFVDRFVRTRLYERLHNGWPVDSPVNALGLWIMWMTITRDHLVRQTDRSLQYLVNTLLPFVIIAFRYPLAHAPPNHFLLPLAGSPGAGQYPHSVMTAHGPYPLYRIPKHTAVSFVMYGETITMAVPPVATAARLLYFSVREIVPFNIPPNLPIDRAHAERLGQRDVGPTQADVHEFNQHIDTVLPPASYWNWHRRLTDKDLALDARHIFSPDLMSPSAKWDVDWKRSTRCVDAMVASGGAMYVPGSLSGLWQGRMLIPNEQPYLRIMSTIDFPVEFSESSTHITTVPIYMRLREHHCISPHKPVRSGGLRNGFDDGLQNAYFPWMAMVEDPAGVFIHTDGRKVLYEKYEKGQATSHNPETCKSCIDRESAAQYNADFAEVGLGIDDDVACDGTRDIIVSGNTDLRHGQAWNHFSYYGRVRAWDGLIAILRVPYDQRLGRVIFYGYLVGGQNFIGNWRPAGADPGTPAWECAFTMSRRE